MQVGPTTFSDAGGAVSDLFAAEGDKYKQQVDLIEQQMYTSDAGLATQNAQFTATSTAIKLAQQSRANVQSQGQTEADVAGAGFANSGSSLDILSNNAQQGALTSAVMQQQGLITEAGYGLYRSGQGRGCRGGSRRHGCDRFRHRRRAQGCRGGGVVILGACYRGREPSPSGCTDSHRIPVLRMPAASRPN